MAKPLPAAPPPAGPLPGEAWTAPLLAALGAFAAFLPALANGFVAWDDDRLLLTNPHFRGWSVENLAWMLTPWPQGGHYDPITWLSFSLDWGIWRLDPFGYHLTSILIHCAAAAAFCWAARPLLEKAGAPRPGPAALFAALLFAIHPLRVESVAWAVERSDVLSGLFYILTVSFYIRRRPGASLACFAASLLSKSIGITLPVVLVIFDIYPLKRLPSSPRAWVQPRWRAVWMEKLPFAAMAVAAAVMAAWVQSNSEAMRSLDALPLRWRAGIASYALTFYLGKTIFPASLLPLYPMPPEIAGMLRPMALSAAAAVLITVLACRRAKAWPALLAAWAFYLVTILPVSGLAHSGPQIVADRYSYLSCAGWALLGGWGLARLPGRTAWAAAGIWTAVLASLTWGQCGIWRDTESLWAAAAARDPRHFVARNFLGNIRAEQGRTSEALSLYKEALGIHPGYGSAHNNLANLLVRLGRPEEALPHYAAALMSSPGHRAIHFNWGIALERLGRREEAARHFRQELATDPGHRDSRLGLERVLGSGKTRDPRKGKRGDRLPRAENAQGGT